MKLLLLSGLLLTVWPALASAETASAADRHLQESRAALRAGDAKRAVELAEAAVAAAPDRSDLHAHLGSAYSVRIREVNFVHRAIISGKMLGAFERAVALDPNNLGGRIGLARYYTHAPAIAGGSREKAEAEAAQIKQRHPFLGACEYGNIAAHFGDHAAAIAAYHEALELKPDDPAVHERLAAAYQAHGDKASARRHLERALELDPARASAREALARLAGAAP